MRESNFCLPAQNRAAVTITSGLYDRRALDCSAVLPLVNSLSHLSFLTSTSSRIRELLTEDHGLERLICVLKEGRCGTRLELWRWQLAFQCVVNVGIRGSESVRTRVVQADMVPVIVTLLDGFLQRLEMLRDKEGLGEAVLRRVRCFSEGPGVSGAVLPVVPLEMSSLQAVGVGGYARSAPFRPTTYHPVPNVMDSDDGNSDDVATGQTAAAGVRDEEAVMGEDQRPAGMFQTPLHTIEGSDLGGETMDDPSTMLSSHAYPFASIELSTEHDMPLPTAIPDPHPLTTPTFLQTQPPLPPSFDSRHFFFRNEDNIIFCLQLLAYISKYPQLRPYFQNSHDVPELRYHYTGETSDSNVIPVNVFALVERFTLRIHPVEVQYWAGVIMRNACRKDESRGGIRQCAYIDCGRWESFNRQFAKCRRCRRTKYCSKQCQSRAWPGHRWWCRERSNNCIYHF